MLPRTTTIDDPVAHRDLLARSRYGVIETSAGQLRGIVLRPWPKLLSWPEVWPVGRRFHGRGPVDRCRLYYNQPRRMPNYLALKYVVTTPGTRFATFRAALEVLDSVAAIKGIDAIVCDAANGRLTDRVMNRLGWEPLHSTRWHRNFIRRFYGTYPPAVAGLATPTTAPLGAEC